MSDSLQDSRLSDAQKFSLNKLLDKVAEKQLKDFGKINSNFKPDGTLITDCDRWSDNEIVKGISQITNNQEGVLSEEGSKQVPPSSSYWIVDPLDGTTNFAAGIPYWAISVARFVNSEPETAFLDVPSLKKRIYAVKGKGVWLNNKKLEKKHISLINNNCVSLCSRSIKILQKQPEKTFPGKVRLLGVSSLNMTSVALGQTIGAIEATPKIWDLAAAWLILEELDCQIKWLDKDPRKICSNQDLSSQNFPLLATSSNDVVTSLMPWAEILVKN